MYERDRKKLSDYLREQGAINARHVSEELSSNTLFTEELLNRQFRISTFMAWALFSSEFSGKGEELRAVFSSFHKNMFLFYSSLELTKQGLYGPARTLMRTIYEGLIIGKYCSIHHDDTVFRKWSDGEYINVNSLIFNKIGSPATTEMRHLWKMLNQFAHASVFAQQIYIEYGSIKGEIESNFVLLDMLLDMNYHLLNRHWLNQTLVYYIKRYQEDQTFGEAREGAKKLIKAARHSFSPASKKLVIEYSRAWKIEKNV